MDSRENMWRVLLRSAFGSSKDSAVIGANILAVDCGLKQSYLWDAKAVVGAHRVEKIEAFMNTIRWNGLTRNHLRAFEIHGEIFVARRVRDVEPDFRPDRVAVVDVRGREPKLLDGSVSSKGVCDCAVAVWGAVLGFPTVYFVGSDVNERGSGLVLAGVDLRVTELVATVFEGKEVDVAVASFSYPLSLEADVKLQVAAWRDELELKLKEVVGYEIRTRVFRSESGVNL